MTLIRIADSPGSKRMYDKRFREWNVFKNANAEERDRATRRSRESAAAAAKAKGDVSQEDLPRTTSCARTINRGAGKPPATSPPDSCFPPCSTPSRSGRSSLGLSDLLSDQHITYTTATPESDFGFPSKPRAFSPEHSCHTPDSSLTFGDVHSQDGPEGHSIPRSASSGSSGLAIYKAQLQRLATSPPPSPALDSKSRALGVITLKLRDYYDWQLENIPKGVTPNDYLGRRSPDVSTQYWNTIKNAMYLVKISAGSMEDDPDLRPDRRAWPAFAEAGCIAAEAMKAHPFDFLRNVFATLSPANTSARPELRRILLQFLACEAQSSLSPTHPITLICQELQRDDDCQEVSRRSLQCMLDLFSSNNRLGAGRSGVGSGAATFKLLDSLATLLRRNGEFPAALEILTELLRSCRQVFGRDSDEARAAENELAHLYMSVGECDLALGHCMSVVTRPPATRGGPTADSEGQPASGCYYQDGIAAHTMEDIAEIHQRRGDMEQCIAWLERAASVALAVWGPKAVATGHIIDKMTSLQRRFGRDLLRSAMLWEAALG